MKQFQIVSQVIFEAMIDNYTEDEKELDKFATQLAKSIDKLYHPIGEIIQYYKETKWGNDYIYIKDTKTSKLITNLTNKKTITQKDIETLEQLGFNLIQTINPKYEKNNS